MQRELLQRPQRRSLAVCRIRLDSAPDDHLAAVGLVDVGVEVGGRNSPVEEGLEGLGDECLERMGRDGQLDAGPIAATVDDQPAVAFTTVPARTAPRLVSTPVTLPLRRAMPVTSVKGCSSAPCLSAPRA